MASSVSSLLLVLLIHSLHHIHPSRLIISLFMNFYTDIIFFYILVIFYMNYMTGLSELPFGFCNFDDLMIAKMFLEIELDDRGASVKFSI